MERPARGNTVFRNAMILSRKHGEGTVGRDRMAAVRRRIHDLAEQGLTVGEITARFRGELSETEQEFIWRVACAETRRARDERWMPVPG